MMNNSANLNHQVVVVFSVVVFTTSVSQKRFQADKKYATAIQDISDTSDKRPSNGCLSVSPAIPTTSNIASFSLAYQVITECGCYSFTFSCHAPYFL